MEQSNFQWRAIDHNPSDKRAARRIALGFNRRNRYWLGIGDHLRIRNHLRSLHLLESHWRFLDAAGPYNNIEGRWGKKKRSGSSRCDRYRNYCRLRLSLVCLGLRHVESPLFFPIAPLVCRPMLVIKVIGHVYEHGTWALAGFQFSGIVLGIVWLIEAGMIFSGLQFLLAGRCRKETFLRVLRDGWCRPPELF